MSASPYAASRRSPVSCPNEPPRKPNSKERSTHSRSPTTPVPYTTDSSSPVRSAARSRAASYPAQPSGPSGGRVRGGGRCSVKPVAPVSSAIVSRAVMRREGSAGME